jgi:opacity protein-like surface antigen
MPYWTLVLTTAVCLFLKVSLASAAEDPSAININTGMPTAIPVAAPAPEKAATNINIYAPGSTAPRHPEVASHKYEDDDVSSVIGAKARAQDDSPSRISLIPMVGTSDFNGDWGKHVSNSYSVGLALEVAATSNLAVEIEGGYSRYSTLYSYAERDSRYYTYGHDFNQYQIGANAKFYVIRSVISPYLGGGIAGLYYDGMDRGPYFRGQNYNHWVGSGQLLAGADVDVTRSVAIGVRGAWLAPIFNRPQTQDDGVHARPAYEDAALINSYQYRIMGSVKLAF